MHNMNWMWRGSNTEANCALMTKICTSVKMFGYLRWPSSPGGTPAPWPDCPPHRPGSSGTAAVWSPAAAHCTCQRRPPRSPPAPRRHSCTRRRSVGCRSPTGESGPRTSWRGSGKGQRCRSGGFHNACTQNDTSMCVNVWIWEQTYYLIN